MRRNIALVAVLGLGALQAEAGERARIYLDLDRGGLYGFGIDYRDYGYRDGSYRDGYYRRDRYGYWNPYRHGPPYGRAYGYWHRPRMRYYEAYRDGWCDGRRYERHWDGKHGRHRYRDHDD